MDSNPGKTSTENINEVILRLLKLKTGTELDYQTYAKKLKIKLASSRMVGAFIPAEEDILLREEFKRVRNKEGRFVILKSKKTKVSSPPPPSESGGSGGNPPKTGSIVKAPPSGKITTEKLFNTPRVEPVNVRDITPDRSSQVDPLIRISDILDSILETLTNINNFDREQATRQRTDAENKRRSQRETDLESKPFEGIKKALSAITKPFQSIWDRIVNFITNVILGRIVIKLLEWFGDPKNQEKIQSIIRFLGDHWPTLLALYLRFGTGIGRFVGKLTRSLVKGSFKLVKLVAGLAAKLGLKRAGKLASFLGGPRGRAIATGVGIAADVAVTAGTAFGASKLFGGEDKKQEPVAPEPVQQFSGGGSVKIPKFAGGGFANFGNMFKGAGMGSMFGPMGMLAGAALGSGKPQEMFSGLVKGPGGPKDDKIAARLSDGEFVMSAGAVKKYGVGTLEAMNAAGGGDNKPKFANGSIYAAGGGLINAAQKLPKIKSLSNVNPDKQFIKLVELWHGTNDKFLESMKTYGIDAAGGRDGALGRGFYTTPDKGIAKLYAQLATKMSGGDQSFARLLAPKKSLDRYSQQVGRLNAQDPLKYSKQNPNARIQYTNNFTPPLFGNKKTSSMYVFGGQSNLNPDTLNTYGPGSRIGLPGRGLSDMQQNFAGNLANQYARNAQILGESRIRNTNAPQRWHPSNKPRVTPKTPKVPEPVRINTSSRAPNKSPWEFAWEKWMKDNPEHFNRGGKFNTGESSSKAAKDFMLTYRRTGKPPEWANIKSKTTRVSSPSSGSTQTPPPSRPPSSTSTGGIKPKGNIPKGRILGGSLSAVMAGLEFKGRKDEGQTNVQAGLGAGGSALGGQLGWMAGAKAGAVAGAALGTIVPGVGNGVGAVVGAIVGGLAGGYGGSMLGGKLADDFSGVNSAKERNSRGGIGGAIKGGYGLTKQEFKDAPKTSIITDDKGRPSIGHKAMKNGQLHYVRGPQPGTGTKNPLEMLGRFINPNSYKDNDTKLAMKNQKIAMVNALESMQKQGMAPDAQARMMKQMGGNLKDVQNDLNYRNKPKPKLTRRQEDIEKYKASMGPRYTAANISSSQRRRTPNITPLPKPKPKPIVAGTGGGGKRGSGSSSSSGSKAPSHSATHSSGTLTHKQVLGILR
jgi:hypothetical protein